MRDLAASAQLALHHPITDVQCDESGICEIADKLKAGYAPPSRLVESSEKWATLVDISPVTAGHCLTVPYSHVIRSTQLDFVTFVQYGEQIDSIVSRLSSLGFGRNIIAIEHGSASNSRAASCVRHCHTHVSPVQVSAHDRDAVAGTLAEYADFDAAYDNWTEAFRYARDLDGYLLVRTADSILIGQPKSGIRQISRVLLAALNNRPEHGAVDWVLDTKTGITVRQSEKSTMLARQLVKENRRCPPYQTRKNALDG